jgi:hypothetical protein
VLGDDNIYTLSTKGVQVWKACFANC